MSAPDCQWLSPKRCPNAARFRIRSVDGLTDAFVCGMHLEPAIPQLLAFARGLPELRVTPATDPGGEGEP